MCFNGQFVFNWSFQAFITYGGILKLNITTRNLKFQLQLGMINLTCPMDHIQFQIFKIILSMLLKNKRLQKVNPPIQIYPNKIKNRIVFKIKSGYKLELLSPETMKLLRCSKNDVDKDKDGEDIPKLELLKSFQYTVIQSLIVIRKHPKYHLLLCLIYNWVS